MGPKPKDVKFDFKTSEFSLNMSLRFEENEEPTKEDRAKRLGKIVEKFADLSPEIQEMILNFADLIDDRVGEDEEENGQDPNTL